MSELKVAFANGRTIAFDIPEAGQACFVLSVRKCGSTIANHVCEALAKANGRGYIGVGDILFRNNMLAKDWQRDPALRQILRPSVIYGGFRDAPIAFYDHPEFVKAPKIVMIRDPRDALVSEYFSIAYSHPVPAPTAEFDDMTANLLAMRKKAQEIDIRAFVVDRASPMAATFLRLEPVLGMPGVRIIRYEDVILDKARLIAGVAEHFGLAADERLVATIMEWADVIPTVEDPHAFVRQVIPGDHRRKLDAPTIGRLNEILEAPMRLFGYAKASAE